MSGHHTVCVRGQLPIACSVIVSDPLAGLQADLDAQRDFVATRAPAYATVLDFLGPELTGDVAARLRTSWADRSFTAWYERPLLLLSAIRQEALAEGESHPLSAALRSKDPDASGVNADSVRAALGAERSRMWDVLRLRSVQTNDTARAIAWIWPAALFEKLDPGRPIALFDIGASAGLNLIANELAINWARSNGGGLECSPLPKIVTRTGFDVSPLDVLSDDDASWLRAAMWPGQAERSARLEAAIDAFREASRDEAPPSLERVTAAEIPARLPRVSASDPRAIAYQTIMRDYLSPEENQRYEDGMMGWLTACEPAGALWIELEVTPDARSGGHPVALSAHIRSRGEIRSLRLAGCEPHPRSLEVDDAGLGELERLMNPS